MIKKLIVRIIDFYRNYLSQLKLPSCRYYPTCSLYTRKAVNKYGPLKGLLMGAFRLLRCHPLSKGGYDPLR